MAFSLDIQSTLSRHQQAIDTALRHALSTESDITLPQSDVVLGPFYGQMKYHLGWVDSSFAPTAAHPGKLLRPTLLLLAYEISGAWDLVNETPVPSDQTYTYLRRALPAAAAIELTHNCTLIAYCQEFLAQQCKEAHTALANVPRRSDPVSTRAFNDMETIVNFLEEAAH